MKMKRFRTLNLAVKLYKRCYEIKTRRSIKDQLDRASLSIVLNLSEGSAKPSEKDRKRFYYIALGSLREVQVILMLVGTIADQILADKVGAHLYRLIHPKLKACPANGCC